MSIIDDIKKAIFDTYRCERCGKLGVMRHRPNNYITIPCSWGSAVSTCYSMKCKCGFGIWIANDVWAKEISFYDYVVIWDYHKKTLYFMRLDDVYDTSGVIHEAMFICDYFDPTNKSKEELLNKLKTIRLFM